MLAEMNRISFLLLFIYRKIEIDWTKQRTSIAYLQNFLSARRSFDLLKCRQTFCPLFLLFCFKYKGRDRFIVSMHACQYCL